RLIVYPVVKASGKVVHQRIVALYPVFRELFVPVPALFIRQARFRIFVTFVDDNPDGLSSGLAGFVMFRYVGLSEFRNNEVFKFDQRPLILEYDSAFITDREFMAVLHLGNGS